MINHKTKQTETRVQRQIVMEDGKVIADSGPQVTTKTKEDNDQEEVESSSKKKHGNASVNPGHGYIRVPGADQIVSEKVETRSKTRSAKQEQLQYHDEGLRELTGFEVHKKALVSPNELIELRDELESKPRGNLTHYSVKARKTCDKEEMKEIGKVNHDGERTTEVTRTLHHEEIDDDELPEHETVGIQLPEAYKETSRKVQYKQNYSDEDEEDALDRQINQRLAISNVERHHDAHINYDAKNANGTTNKWVENHFGSDHSDHSGGSAKLGASEEIIRRFRTKTTGGNAYMDVERLPASNTNTQRSERMSTNKNSSHFNQQTAVRQVRQEVYYSGNDSRESSPSPPISTNASSR